MSDATLRGTLMGFQIVLGALVETHQDIVAFKQALERGVTNMHRAAEDSPDDMLHPAEHVVEMFLSLADSQLKQRD